MRKGALVHNMYTIQGLIRLRCSKSFLLEVKLSNPLDVDGTVSLVLETVETHATYPWPQSAGQGDEQKLKYNTSLFIVSPYHTAIQRTKIK